MGMGGGIGAPPHPPFIINSLIMELLIGSPHPPRILRPPPPRKQIQYHTKLQWEGEIHPQQIQYSLKLQWERKIRPQQILLYLLKFPSFGIVKIIVTNIEVIED